MLFCVSLFCVCMNVTMLPVLSVKLTFLVIVQLNLAIILCSELSIKVVHQYDLSNMTYFCRFTIMFLSYFSGFFHERFRLRLGSGLGLQLHRSCLFAQPLSKV